jgi:peptide deformylase
MKILTYPNPILTQISEPVTEFDDELKDFCSELYDIMIKNDGVGLSAVQVGVLKRIIVMQAPEELAHAFINPEIIERARGMFVYSEGCLSVPGFYDDRARNVGIRLRYQTPTGETVEKWFEELESFVIQHEMDHLEGKLFIDDLSPLKKDRVRKKIEKTLRRK